MRKTERGFGIKEFLDGNGEKCSIQQSSACRENDFNPTENGENPGGTMLWLGLDGIVPRMLKPGVGWVSVELPDGASCYSRMHLTRAQAAEIGAMLTHWANTGELVEAETEDPRVEALAQADSRELIRAALGAFSAQELAEAGIT